MEDERAKPMLLHKAAALWRLWEEVHWVRPGDGDAEEILYRRKKQWLAKAAAFVENLPDGTHLWCRPGLQHVVWQLLEPLRFHPHPPSGRLKDLWEKLSSPLRGCLGCVSAYHAAKDFYRQSHELELLDVLRDLDIARAVSSARRILQKLDVIDREEMCQLLEVMMFPENFQDDKSIKLLTLALRHARNTMALSPDYHPEVLELLSSVRNAAQKLAVNAARVDIRIDRIGVALLFKTLLPGLEEYDAQSKASANDHQSQQPECVSNFAPEPEFEEIEVPLLEIVEFNAAGDELMNNNESLVQDPSPTEIDVSDAAPDDHEEQTDLPNKKRHASASIELDDDVPCKKQKQHAAEIQQPDFHDRVPHPGMLEEWYKRVLSLNVYGEPAEELLEVPLTFRDYQHYLDVFRPLCFEEFKAYLRRFREAADLTRADVVTMFSLRQEGHFHFVVFIGQTAPLMENELVLLRGLGSDLDHMIGKVEKRSTSDLVVKVYLPYSCERLSRVREMLVPDSKWRLNKLVFVTTFVREQQAMSAMHSFPLLETILAASPPTNVQTARHIPEDLRAKLQREYNESQLSAIDAVADRALSLVQGPPGTGKTRTILGIISALLSHANEQVENARVQELLSLQFDSKFDSSQIESRETASKATRILVCAQSNAAVDELATRISKHGVYSHDGCSYFPSLVRVGDAKRVHADVKAVHIDRLVEKRLAAIEGIRSAQSPEELRAQLDEVHCDMQALAAPSETNQNVDAKLEKLEILQERQRKLLAELLRLENRTRSLFTGSHWKRKQGMQLEVLREADVVLTTLSGCGGHMYATFMELIAKSDPQAAELLFDAVIIDEAAQAVEPSTLIPLQLLKNARGKCILIGDPKQLPATVASDLAAKMLFDCSMFERLQKNGYPVSVLKTQYRMHPCIRSFPSTHFYGNQLEDGATVLNDNRKAVFHIERRFGPYRFFDISDGVERQGLTQSLTNPDEAEFIFLLLCALRNRYPEVISAGRVGVITPYLEQKKVLQQSLKKLHCRIEVNTVDSFQGREADIIVLSTVRASSAFSVGFLADVRRMNVALTRAKFALWIVGHARTLESNADWKALVLDSRRRGLFSSVRKPYKYAINALV